jgi:uncharacterized membrane protein YfcA
VGAAPIQHAQVTTDYPYVAEGIVMIVVGFVLLLFHSLQFSWAIGFVLLILGIYLLTIGRPIVVLSPYQSRPHADRYCPSCGAGNANANAFCQQCGKSLPPAAM